jgi:hypothetical protein
MSSQERLKSFPLHKGEAAVVDRVVPGRLVYVTREGAASYEASIGFKLNQLIIHEPDGSFRPYRGEPLSDLGVVNGRLVIVGATEEDGEPTLVVEHDPRSVKLRARLSANAKGLATTISTAVANTIGWRTDR